jgi:hypothetical protein
MERGENVSDAVEKGLGADECSIVRGGIEDVLTDARESWLKLGHPPARARWLAWIVERLKGEELPGLIQGLPEAQAEVLRAVIRGELLSAIAPALLQDFDRSIHRDFGMQA